jgi:hypothetical protein
MPATILEFFSQADIKSCIRTPHDPDWHIVKGLSECDLEYKKKPARKVKKCFSPERIFYDPAGTWRSLWGFLSPVNKKMALKMKGNSVTPIFLSF